MGKLSFSYALDSVSFALNVAMTKWYERAQEGLKAPKWGLLLKCRFFTMRLSPHATDAYSRWRFQLRQRAGARIQLRFSLHSGKASSDTGTAPVAALADCQMQGTAVSKCSDFDTRNKAATR